MTIHFLEYQGDTLAEIASTDTFLHNAQDALELLVNCAYQGAHKIILQASHLNPDFFDLKTGIAGEILQKVSNYNLQLAIVGDFSQISSKSLKDFIFESNKMGRVNFVASVEEAKNRLCCEN